jgi:hypothetical protein
MMGDDDKILPVAKYNNNNNNNKLHWGNRVGICGLYSSGSGQLPLSGSCEHLNEPSGSVRRVIF